MTIDPRAVVDPSARLAAGVEIGPFAVVGPDVVLGEGTRLAAHAVVLGPTTLGARNVIHSFAVVGGPPQHRTLAAHATTLTVGDDNEFREHVTVHRGTGAEATRIGSGNLFMAGVHVAHDVVLGDRCAVANGTQLAGHVVVGDDVTFGGLAGIAQRVRIGDEAFVAAGAMCERDVPPYLIVGGDRARPRAVNRIGLERRGASAATIAELERVFRVLYKGRGTFAEALAALTSADPRGQALLAFLRQRG
jgi:UDP-N-acetylglucosamine acyltransferase